jgi:hypothetical protein
MNVQTILIIIIAFGIGYGFAMLDRRVTKGMKESREEAQKEPKIVERVVPEKSALSLALDDLSHPRLRMDGIPLTPGQVTADQRKRLIALLNLIRPWVDTGPVQAPAPASASPSVAAKQVGPAALGEAEEVKPAPTIDVARGFRAMMYNAVITEEPSQGTGILKQIDDILQQKLAASPYADKYVHMEEGPGGEVLVLIGAQKFNGIDTVPDRGIQALIRESVSEWERRGGR